jgi:hypothetical protein
MLLSRAGLEAQTVRGSQDGKLGVELLEIGMSPQQALEFMLRADKGNTLAGEKVIEDMAASTAARPLASRRGRSP